MTSAQKGLRRKSKRVAKRQEDEIFWLMHNFPSGIEYKDLCDEAVLRQEKSPEAEKTKDILTTVKEKLSSEGCSAKVAMKMPRMLRSGKSIAQEDPCTSTETTDGEKSDSGKDCVIPEDGKDPEDPGSVLAETEGKEDKEDKSETAISPKSSRKRKTMSHLSSEESDDSDLSPEIRAQIVKVKMSKLPKFKSDGARICTRSGATYSFSWKDASGKPCKAPPGPPVPACKKISLSKRANSFPQEKQMVTRGSRKKSGQQTAETEKKPTSKVSIVKVPKVKSEPLEPLEPKEATLHPKKIKVGPPNMEYAEFAFPGSHPSMQATRPKSLNLTRKRQKKRLSLLPTQKTYEEENIAATWFDALESNREMSPSIASSPLSRAESPISPTSSTPSENNPGTPKRVGRTASLNCRAVLSALMKPEPGKKSRKSSPNNVVATQKVKQTEPKVNKFFKVCVTPSYSQKVEYISNGLTSKVQTSPTKLKAHEARVMANVDRVKVHTNGWTWIGSFIWSCSFYREMSKTTRLYFSAMERDGVELRVGDSVALQTSDADNNPFVGKIVAMWQENLGEMMVTLCWFYRPSDLENVKTPFGVQEVYLSKHTDDNSVATIQNKVYVLSFPEYCRFYANQAEKKQRLKPRGIVPNVLKWRETILPSKGVPDDSIYFCRGVYDFRLKRTLKQQLYYTRYL